MQGYIFCKILWLGGRGEMTAGEKIGIKGKMKKGIKKRKFTLKNEEKALKNASFWVINSKKFRGVGGEI